MEFDLEDAEIFLRRTHDLAERMVSVREGELLPALASESASRRFGVRGKPMPTAAGVREVAKRYLAAFADEGEFERSALEEVRRVAEKCITRATFDGDYSLCASDNAAVREALGVPEATLAAYEAERIVPLHFSQIPTPVGNLSSAATSCAQVKHLGERGGRPPTRDEVVYLAPQINSYTGREINLKRAWFSGGTTKSGGPCGNPYFEPSLGAEPLQCFEGGLLQSLYALAICVPQEGLNPLLGAGEQ